ncbi:MAG: hypothetical protein KF889_18750 [Alphaproteobacteria bacterium]|nr:hypothetical protein [Alphaproteobacteria bacterium]MCW5743891.1 hypothetical protein [Alphaproteobacteria bacterium]
MEPYELQFKPPLIDSEGKVEFPLHPKTGVPTPEGIAIRTDGQALGNHLSWGKRAVEWATRHIFFASNRRLDSLMTSGGSYYCVAAVRATWMGTHGEMLERMRKKARVAMAVGCGNCDEQSTVAFLWLYDWWINKTDTEGTSTLAWMQIANGDHLFVLMGYEPGKAAVDKEWGPRAVVVDPWNEKSYAASSIRNVRWNSSGEVYSPLFQVTKNAPKVR